MPFEDFEKSLQGDERAQMRTIIEGLALHLRLVSYSLPEALRKPTQDLADSALDYLLGEKS